MGESMKKLAVNSPLWFKEFYIGSSTYVIWKCTYHLMQLSSCSWSHVFWALGCLLCLSCFGCPSKELLLIPPPWPIGCAWILISFPLQVVMLSLAQSKQGPPLGYYCVPGLAAHAGSFCFPKPLCAWMQNHTVWMRSGSQINCQWSWMRTMHKFSLCGMNLDQWNRRWKGNLPCHLSSHRPFQNMIL